MPGFPSTLFESTAQLDQLLAMLDVAYQRQVLTASSMSLQTALQCLPQHLLAELVTLAECGRLRTKRTFAELRILMRIGPGREPKSELVRVLLDVAAMDLIARGLENVVDTRSRDAEG